MHSYIKGLVSIFVFRYVFLSVGVLLQNQNNTTYILSNNCKKNISLVQKSQWYSFNQERLFLWITHVFWWSRKGHSRLLTKSILGLRSDPDSELMSCKIYVSQQYICKFKSNLVCLVRELHAYNMMSFFFLFFIFSEYSIMKKRIV